MLEMSVYQRFFIYAWVWFVCRTNSIKNCFNSDFDVNGDNSIHSSEINRMWRLMSCTDASQYVDTNMTLFSTYDTNNDSKLSCNEFNQVIETDMSKPQNICLHNKLLGVDILNKISPFSRFNLRTGSSTSLAMLFRISSESVNFDTSYMYTKITDAITSINDINDADVINISISQTIEVNSSTAIDEENSNLCIVQVFLKLVAV